MNLNRIGVKFFLDGGDAVALAEYIPIFHRWIQNHSVDGVLIDVADYSHVYAGPGVLLIAHEGNYSMDESGDRRGLVYYSKHTRNRSLSDSLASVCKTALNACLQLEREPELEGRITFVGHELQIFANDRLSAPNTHETFTAFEPLLAGFLDSAYAGADYSVTREPDPGERFSVTVKAAQPVKTSDLLARLAALNGGPTRFNSKRLKQHPSRRNAGHPGIQA